MASPYAPGDFVNCLFPFGEYPDRPGPTPHVVYSERLFVGPSGGPAMLAFYTTTVLRRPSEPKRAWIIQVPEGNARKMGMQKAFAIDTHRIGFLRIDKDFFPDMERTDHGIRGHATEHLQKVLSRKLAEATRDLSILRLAGPELPWPPRTRGRER